MVETIIPVDAAEKAEKTSKALKIFGDITKEAGEAAKDLISKISGIGDVFKTVGAGGSIFGSILNNLFSENAAGAKEFSKSLAGAFAVVRVSAIRDLVDPTKTASDFIRNLGKDAEILNTSLKHLLTTENLARTAIYATSDGMKTYAERMKDANNIANDYPAALHRSAGATGFFTTELMAVDKAAAIIPGAFREMSISTRDFGGALESRAINPSHATMVALRGLGFEAGEMSDKIITMYKSFDQSGKPAINSLAEIARAGQLSGVNTKLAYEQISKASEVFGIFGGTVSSAAETWTDFNVALGKVVPVEDINRMVGSITSGIAKMSLQHRAFITQVSGAQPGAGMLGGALKMEMAMRTPEGMGQNMKALTDTLSKFAGGKIVTIQQAVEMPELETQFVMQRQLLGQLVGIQDAEQQNRILEVLNKTQMGGMTQIDASKEVGNLMKGGQSLQQQTVTHLETLVQIGRQFTHSLNNSLRNLEQPASKGLREISMSAASSTEGREMPKPPKLHIAENLQKIFSDITKPNKMWETPGGYPSMEEFGLGGGGGGGGMKSVPVYSGVGETGVIKKREEQPLESSPNMRAEKISAALKADASIRSATTVLNVLKESVKDNTKMIEKELNSPIMLELKEICPSCNMETIQRALGKRTGVAVGVH